MTKGTKTAGMFGNAFHRNQAGETKHSNNRHVSERALCCAHKTHDAGSSAMTAGTANMDS